MRTPCLGVFLPRALLPLAVPLVLLLAPASSAAAWGSKGAAVATRAWRADPLSITVPTLARLGNADAGTTLSASMGTVSVTDTRAGLPTWTATVSATSFTTGSGSSTYTIPNSQVSYWSGPTVGQSGGGTRTPGQATATSKVTLSAPATAFRGRKQAAQPQFTSWQPTLVITIPSAAAGGAYSGTVSHSVA